MHLAIRPDLRDVIGQHQTGVAALDFFLRAGDEHPAVSNANIGQLHLGSPGRLDLWRDFARAPCKTLRAAQCPSRQR
jgi:hypothetical protein